MLCGHPCHPCCRGAISLCHLVLCEYVVFYKGAVISRSFQFKSCFGLELPSVVLKNISSMYNMVICTVGGTFLWQVLLCEGGCV